MHQQYSQAEETVRTGWLIENWPEIMHSSLSLSLKSGNEIRQLNRWHTEFVCCGWMGVFDAAFRLRDASIIAVHDTNSILFGEQSPGMKGYSLQINVKHRRIVILSPPGQKRISGLHRRVLLSLAYNQETSGWSKEMLGDCHNAIICDIKWTYNKCQSGQFLFT